MKKNDGILGTGKGILKRTGEGIFLYMLPCLIGAALGYSQGEDLRITVHIAGFVILFVLIWAIVSLIRKEPDPRKYTGYMLLFISMGILLQVIIQGNILEGKRIIVCVAGYIFFAAVGTFICLIATGKIVIKSRFIREVGEVALAMGGFLLALLVRMQRTYSGRRVEVLVELTGGREKSADVIWYCVLALAWLYVLLCSYLITEMIVLPENYKNYKW